MRRFPDGDRWLPYLLAGPIVGFFAISLFAAGAETDKAATSVFAIAVLVAAASFVSGGLLGFLFGIPRSLSAEGAPVVERSAVAGDGSTAAVESVSRAATRPNTNLEQISDWLTKILVGVGLVQLGKLMAAGSDLVDSLAPALGGGDVAPAFAASILLLYTISGFLIVYLLTRVYLGAIFAHADELARVVENRVEAKRNEQEERDVRAVALVSRQLDPEGVTAPTQAELNEALTAALPLTRQAIFNRARQRRQQGSPQQKGWTAPVFRGLIAADAEDRFHRNHAQLAYALREGQPQDLEGAVEALDKAIEVRDRIGEPGFRIYELNRALARIEAEETAEQPDDDTRDAVLADLRKAAESKFLLGRMGRDAVVTAWLKRNGLSANDLAPGAGG